jgi:hypothetical protein
LIIGIQYVGFGSIGKGMAYSERNVSNGENANSGSPNNLMRVGGADSNDSGELIDYQDMNVLSQFHEDAIKQVIFNIPLFFVR